MGRKRPAATITVAGPRRRVAVSAEAWRSPVRLLCRTALVMVGSAALGSPRVVRASTLQFLIPPLLQRHVVRRHVGVVEIDQGLDLLRAEANALVELGCHHGIADRGVVAHIDGEGLLRSLL